jgi:hypothetical protein
MSRGGIGNIPGKTYEIVAVAPLKVPKLSGNFRLENPDIEFSGIFVNYDLFWH